MKVYVAASSADIIRAKRWIANLRILGCEVTSDWPEIITQVGIANPREASEGERREWSSHDLTGVEDADVVWFLVPNSSNGRGAYFEVGYATALGKHVIYSGDTRQSIFCAQGREYRTDEEAFTSLETTVEDIHEWLDS